MFITPRSMREMAMDNFKRNKIPKFGVSDYQKESLDLRCQWLNEITGIKLEHICSYSIPPESMHGNIESPLGVCQVPLGITGPLHVKGDFANGNFFVPMATTEGALVLTYQMGIKVISMSGGARVKVLHDLIHIDPLFYLNDLDDTQNFIHWINSNFIQIKEVAESTTRYGKLQKIEPIIVSRAVVLKFLFTTGDAHGLNMINKACEKACQFIKTQTKKHFILRSHFSSIKGAASSIIHSGQAKAVMAETTVPRKVIQKIFKLDPEQIEKYYKTAILAGIYSGRIGATCHAANAIAAIFLACGQDIADVSVSHVGITNFEVTETGDLYSNIFIPNLFVGTIGGGTGLGTQKECLQIMDCYGKDKVYKFSEIIGAVVLAGEISVIAALVSGTYVEAHERHGRKRPDIQEPIFIDGE